MNEITKLDDKYLVLKWEDIHNELSAEMRRLLGEIILSCDSKRLFPNQYLVLNLDDMLNWYYLSVALDLVMPLEKGKKNIKVEDIAVALVNAILKAKEDK